MKKSQLSVEVCFSPALYNFHHNVDKVVVVVDILRATTAICSAFMNGVSSIIPIGSSDEAREYKSKGFMVAAERDGLVLDFADFGNSPYNFTPDRVSGKQIVYSTTNGTNAIQMASSCYRVGVGAFLNLDALALWIASLNREVVILCAGWKNRFSLEDSVFAGALTDKLIGEYQYDTKCDSVLASLDLWEKASPNLIVYMLKAAQKARLAANGLDDVFEYCLTPNLTTIIPVLEHNLLIPFDSKILNGNRIGAIAK